ncbi:MAG: aldo/keto reductase [Chloroflexota bacterium]
MLIRVQAGLLPKYRRGGAPIVEYRRLGRTNLQVSLMGLGSGGKSRLGQAHGLAQDEIIPIVRRAFELGVNIVDTSPEYGESETLLGNALADVPRDSYTLCTKMMPFRAREGTLRPQADLRESIETSLRQLKTDHLDVLYLHGVPPDLLDEVMERFQEPLVQAQRDGLVRFLGITETFATDHEHLTLRTVIPQGLFDVVMVGYNVLSPAPAQHVLPLAQRHDVGVVIMCAVRGVLLSSQRIREVVGEWKDEGLLPRDGVPDDEPLGWLTGPWADSVPAAAYKFAADHPAVGTVLTGTGRIAHLEANAEAILGTKLPPALVERVIKTFGPVSRNASF